MGIVLLGEYNTYFPFSYLNLDTVMYKIHILKQYMLLMQFTLWHAVDITFLLDG